MHRLAIIGCGKIGQAILRGLVRSGVVAGKDIVVCDLARGPLADVLAETGCDFTLNPGEAVGMAEVVVLAVKPKDVERVLIDIPPGAVRDKLLISVAAGCALRMLAGWLPPGTRVVRAMPNAPALVCKGVTAYTAESEVTAADHGFVRSLFSALGSVHQMAEPELEVATGLSGSGPAYLMTVVEAMADGAVRCGLGRDLAVEMAARTMAGAAELILETGQHPAIWRDAIASPGGTTMAGLAALEARGVRAAFIEAVTAATLRGREMAAPHRNGKEDEDND